VPADIVAEAAKEELMALNKLVRDRVDAIMERRGYIVWKRTLGVRAYRKELRRKLLEEAREVSRAPNKSALLKELADCYEVIDALIEEYGLDRRMVRLEQAFRRMERGGFRRRLYLIRAKAKKKARP
jgi:predicted house-cleaning noncanonical NTP pyrophosphatase (MazG superfamily)